MGDAFVLATGVAPGGRRGGAVELAAAAVVDAVAGCGLDAGSLDRLVLGCSVPAEPRDLSLAPAVAQQLGVAPRGGSFGVALADASGLLAIALAADAVRAGAVSTVAAGGADAPSRVPYWVEGLRGGPRETAARVADPLARRITDDDGGDRAAQDRFALRSHERAGRARDADALAALKPVHSTEGTITSGNAARLVDGASAAVVGAAPARGPQIRIVDWTLTARAARGGGAAVAAAVAQLCARIGIAPAELAVIEIHEESAALCLATTEALGLEPGAINRRGGAIATGAPGAASGPLLVRSACGQLAEAPGRATGVVAMPAPGGGALALALERD